MKIRIPFPIVIAEKHINVMEMNESLETLRVFDFNIKKEFRISFFQAVCLDKHSLPEAQGIVCLFIDESSVSQHLLTELEKFVCGDRVSGAFQSILKKVSVGRERESRGEMEKEGEEKHSE